MDAKVILDEMAALKAAEPKLYARDLAAKIGISEAELVAAQVGQTTIRLRPEMADIMQQLPTVGRLMALTRNEACVIERKGVYPAGKFYHHAGMDVGLLLEPKGVDLRLIMMHWKHVFAVEDQVKGNHSLQFFNKAGEALHKVYLTDASNKAKYDALIADFKSDDQEPGVSVEPMDPMPANKPDAEVDWQAFRSSWETLQEVHDFHPMLRKFKVGREQAFRKVGEDFAYEVDNIASRRILHLAKENQCEIMSFVGNRGCIQINTSIPDKLVERGSWFNVLDTDFNLHLNEAEISRSWVTKKPSRDGIITSVEVVDTDGNIIITFYGQRVEGQQELTAWRDIVDQLPKKKLFDAAE